MKAFADVLALAPGALVGSLPRESRERTCGERAPTAVASTVGGDGGEESLCAAALAGDAASWNTLIQRHNHRVVVALLARGVRVDRAKDIAQEAWMRLVEQQRLGRLERLQLPGLAIAQATFLALEAARREASARLHENVEQPAIAAALADPRGDAESRLLTEERVARAVDVLSRCSPSARKVFRLAYGGEGLSHGEVAQRVGLSLQRVRQILCEIRAKLRVELEGERGE
jgi:RNA polymerase sigma factor (sigma-70 family)